VLVILIMINDSNNIIIIISLATIAIVVAIVGSFSKLSPEELELVKTICVGLTEIAVGRGGK
jgi:hypothetical protein